MPRQDQNPLRESFIPIPETADLPVSQAADIAKMPRPDYLHQDLQSDGVTAKQQQIQASRLFFGEKSFQYRNYALTAYDILQALPALSTLVGDDACKKIIGAVASVVTSKEIQPVREETDLKAATEAMYQLVSELKEKLKEEVKAHGIKLKPSELLDFALMERQGRCAFPEGFPLAFSPDLLNAASGPLQRLSACLTSDISVTVDGERVVEQGKIQLLEDRKNPFRTVVSYTEFKKNGKSILVEQSTGLSRENELSDEQVEEYRALVPDAVVWPSIQSLQAREGLDTFVAAYNENKVHLPVWFLSLESDTQRYIIVQLLQAKAVGEVALLQVIKSYSWQGSTFRQTPGRKNAFVDGSRFYRKDNQDDWELIVDELPEVPTRGSVVVNKKLDMPKAELTRTAAQTLRQDIKQRADALGRYYGALFGNPQFGFPDSLFVLRAPVSLLSSGDSEKWFAAYSKLFRSKHSDNNGYMTEIYSEAAALNNARKVPAGEPAALYGLTTNPINEFRESSKRFHWSTLVGRAMLLNTDYEVSGIVATLSFLASELNLVYMSASNDELLRGFAAAALPLVQQLQRRTDITKTSRQEIEALDHLVKKTMGTVLTSDTSGAETLVFVERYAALVSYLRTKSDAFTHDPETPPEQNLAATLQLVLPPSLRDGGCKSAKDREGVKDTTLLALRLYFLMYGEYPQDFDRERGFLNSVRHLWSSKSESSANFREIFARLFLNSHHPEVHSLTAANFGLKSLAKIFTTEQKAALAEVGITEDVIKGIQKVANTTGLKKIKGTVKAREKGCWEKLCCCFAASDVEVTSGNVVVSDQYQDQGAQVADVETGLGIGQSQHSMGPDTSQHSAGALSLPGGPAEEKAMEEGGAEGESVGADQAKKEAADQHKRGEIDRAALHQATKVIVAQLLYSENNPSPLLSMSNAKVALFMGVFGTLFRQQVDQDAIVFQPGWSSPVVVNPDHFTLRGDWSEAIWAGGYLMLFTYFALGVLNGRALVERFAAGMACREPVSTDAASLLQGLSREQIVSISEHLGQKVPAISGDGSAVLSQTGQGKQYLPILGWLLHAGLTAGAVWFFMAGVLNIAAVDEYARGTVIVTANKIGMALGSAVLLFSLREVYHLIGREDQRNSVLAYWLIHSGIVSFRAPDVEQGVSRVAQDIPVVDQAVPNKEIVVKPYSGVPIADAPSSFFNQLRESAMSAGASIRDRLSLSQHGGRSSNAFTLNNDAPNVF